jgi:glucoamylase
MKILITLLLLVSSITHATSLESWMKFQEKASWEKLLANLSPEGASKGTVIASPQRVDPDYFFHWVRDAALVMDVLMEEVRTKPNKALEKHIDQYIKFSHFIQEQYAISGLGEPKYFVDGRGYDGPWGRPQDDGPALRALYIIRHAKHLMKKGTPISQLNHIYSAELPATSLVKRDLEYIAHRWTQPNFDLWEEVYGTHFYTLMVIRQALVEGADLARDFNDEPAAAFYQWQASLVESRMNSMIYNDHFVTTIDRVGGLDYKHSNLDTSILLAFHHSGEKAAYSLTDNRLKKSMTLLDNSFNRVYPLNQRGLSATALGRYPEDTYYGGNPWILTTLAAAEYNYRLARITKNKNLIATGDAYVERVRFHSRTDGAMAEQWDKFTGYHLSADELTWSHASFITAMRERKSALKLFK